MKNYSSLDQDYKLWWLIHQTRHMLSKARAKELRQYGLSGMQAAVLFAIEALGDKATPPAIARLIFRERNSVSDILSRMEKDGLLTKSKDLPGKNLVRVTLTDKGKQLYNQSAKRESVKRIMSSLSEEQRQQLRSCLEVLRGKALEELGVGKPPFPWPR